jgi:hypothetical protein
MPSIYYSDIKTQFSKLCPNLSLLGQDPTIVKQNKILNPPGITIVGHIIDSEAIPFNYAVSKILNSGRKFSPNKLLHFTLLGLFDGRRKNTIVDASSIVQSSKAFIESKRIGRLTISFSLVRPGAFYDQGRPRDGHSDGTIVAMADNDQESEKFNILKFNILGEYLACYLRSKFPSIFYPFIEMKLKREHPTIWCILGYFHEKSDFEIDNKMLLMLDELRSFTATVTVSQLEVRSYTNRSLESSNVLATITLLQPIYAPFRTYHLEPTQPSLPSR